MQVTTELILVILAAILIQLEKIVILKQAETVDMDKVV
jgi:hypothetical protein